MTSDFDVQRQIILYFCNIYFFLFLPRPGTETYISSGQPSRATPLRYPHGHECSIAGSGPTLRRTAFGASVAGGCEFRPAPSVLNQKNGPRDCRPTKGPYAAGRVAVRYWWRALKPEKTNTRHFGLFQT